MLTDPVRADRRRLRLGLGMKVLLGNAAGLVVVSLVIVLLSQMVLLKSYLELERKTTVADARRVYAATSFVLAQLHKNASDWGIWDETWQFLRGEDPAYPARNLGLSTLVNLQLNVMVFLDLQNRVVGGTAVDLVNRREVPLPSGLFSVLSPPSPLSLPSRGKKSLEGIVVLPEGPLLVAARLVTPSLDPGRVGGTLIMGRFLDEQEVKYLGQLTGSPLQFLPFRDFARSKTLDAAASRLADSGLRQPSLVLPLNEARVEGLGLLRDVYGRPALVFRVNKARDIYHRGQRTAFQFLLISIATAMFGSAITLFGLRRMILRRLEQLEATVEAVAATNDLSLRAPTDGGDEVGSLGGAFNDMLLALQRVQDDLDHSRQMYKDASQRYEDILEFLPDPTFVVDAEGKVLAWNQAMELLSGVPKADVIGMGLEVRSVPFYGETHPMLVDLIDAPAEDLRQRYEMVEYRGSTLCAEVFVPAVGGGQGAHLWAAASLLFDSKGCRVGAIQSIRDVTDRSKTRERLAYLSTHDPLTGLYDRHFFEEALGEASRNSQTVGLLSLDVDGLKLVNDTLGHAAGDHLLMATAEVLRGCLRADDVIARIGGDEFAVLLPKCGQRDLRPAKERIVEAIDAFNREHPERPLSLSIGQVFGVAGFDADALCRQADDQMYREKLHRRQSTRSAIVQTLIKALGARDFVTEGHVERLRILMEQVGKGVNFPEPRIYDLLLLAQFHDIGKVGVPDSILSKPGPLTDAERMEMRRHSEIGHRIALESPDLAPIADWILKHHEWWDGSGYPLGLAGTEIPVECRILAIADAYDAMTSDRPYRKAVSTSEALREIERQAGTQFDPDLASAFVHLIRRQTAGGEVPSA